MQQLVLIMHLIIAFLILALIIIQRGKGSDIGAAFGSGASQTVFGSQGSTSFLVKLIAILIALFFISSLLLNYVTTKTFQEQQMENTPQVLLQQQKTQNLNLNSNKNQTQLPGKQAP